MATAEGPAQVEAATDAVAESAAGRWAALLARGWLLPLLPLAPTAVAAIWAHKGPRILIDFLATQDVGVLLASFFAVAVCCLPVVNLPKHATVALAAFAARRGLLACAAMAVALAAFAFFGWFAVYHRYPLSMDEFWASFDARIFQSGRLIARVPDEWRPYVPALQPMWRLPIAGDVFWASNYLPINAAFRALCATLGSAALAGPIWAGASVLTVWALARRYWPERPDAALVCAVLLASSSQVIVTSMSPYAMPAHLGLNLIWLWLFQRKDWASQTGAVAVAFAATGIHQLVFHPVFAAPFVLQLWLRRRWRLAAIQTLAYAAIVLFWALYPGLMLTSQGAVPAGIAAMGLAGFVHKVLGLIFPLDLATLLMAMNLLRFVAWQNPLAIILGLAGAVAAVRSRDSAMLPLLAGIVLTLMVVLVVMPFQGHGWGYRYLHGLLGSLSLLAGSAWVAIVKPGAAVERRAWATLLGLTAFSALVLLPIRCRQASSFILPYARAYSDIRSSKADVVMVDPTGVWYGIDLVRNDPLMADGPKVMSLINLSDDQLRTLCGRYKVALFDRRDAAELGVTTFADETDSTAQRRRALMARLRCG